MDAGQTLAHYEILAKIGVGGMGEVYRARDTKLDRDVAVKILPDAFIRNAERHARFHREAQALAAFSHPHVAGIHSIEEDGHQHFLVMELAEGEDLSARLARNPIEPKRALEIACQIALALEAAHETGLVHRDLKPANIKVTDEDQVKVLDFGLAKMVADDTAAGTVTLGDSPTITSDMTRTGVIMGTAAYMSPEQTRGKVVDKRTDIWAFGCVLFEMLTARPAFPGETLSDTLAAILKTEPDWDQLPDDLHPSILMLLQRSLKRNPRQRLHDIADARLVLEDVLSGTDTVFPTRGAAGLTGPKRGLPLWLGAIGLLAIIGLAAKLWLTSPVEGPTPIRLSTLTFSGKDWSPAASPDGDFVAFTSNRDGIPRIWLKQLASGSEVPITDGSDDMARFSPDGSQILFVHDEANIRHLYRTAVLGGQPRRVMNDVTEADWSPDGTRVAFLRMSSETSTNEFFVGIADVQTGTEKILAKVGNRLCYGIRWSPDGRWLAMIENSLSGNLVAAGQLDLVDIETGEIRQLPSTDLTGSFTAADWAPDSKSFLVGKTQELLSHITGRPGLIMEYFIESETHEPLFWSNFRTPQGGWGFGTIAVLNDRQVVVDGFKRNAILQEFPWPGEGDSDGSGTPRILTTSIGFDRQPVYSPDSRHVLFSSNRAGNIDLWLVEKATGHLQQLTDDPAHDWDPAFSPDNKHILWSSNRGGHMEVWISNRDGSEARQVTQDGRDAENPTMTPDGQWIIYASASDEKIGLWKIRPDGTDAVRLHEGTDLIPEVSPDGRYALFSVIRGLDYVIKVVDLESGEVVPFEIDLSLTQRNQDVVYGRARWTPDGSSIAYVGQGQDGSSGIYVQDFVIGQDTHATRRPVAGFSNLYSSESLAVAPDGKHLVVSTIYNRQTLQMADLLNLENWR
jgi:serine/threonine protein kinase/Tol biopolymer transport system component